MGAPFDRLQEASWRGITFPVSTIRTSVQQDLAEHKYWGKDGARVESTGRSPIVIDVTIPFRNGIAKGRNETWGTDGAGGSGLYPDTMHAFLLAFNDKTIGIFVHPEFGEIACKAKSLDIVHDPNRRDGVDIHAVFVETIVPINDTSPFADPSPAAGAQQAGFDLDLAIATINPPKQPTYTPNFSDSIRQVLSVGDRISLLKKQVGGKFAELKYRADQIENSMAGATNGIPALATAASAAVNGNRAMLWPVIQDCEKIKHVANSGQRGRLLQQQRATSFYIVPQRTTLAGLVLDIPEATIGDLISLNPTLAALPGVEPKTVVRYYTPRTTR